jgi:hypothetical protein
MKLDRRTLRKWLAPTGALITAACLAEACVVPEFYIDDGLGGAGSGGDSSLGGGDGDGGQTAGDGGTSSGDGGAADGAGGQENSGGSPSDGGSDSGGSNSGGSGGTGGTGATCYMPSSTGDVVQITGDGAWSWHSNEHAVVDRQLGKLLVSSNAFETGDTTVVIHDIETGDNVASTVGTVEVDDQAVASLLVKLPGEYVAAWAGHNTNCSTYTSTYALSAWGSPNELEWDLAYCPWTGPGGLVLRVNHNNLWEMSAEDAYYDIVQAYEGGQTIVSWNDTTDLWELAGQLIDRNPSHSPGYFSYFGNGVDRIDFLAVQAHPRDNDNHLYHGYLEGGAVHASDGTVVDADVWDMEANELTDFTEVFEAQTVLGGVALGHTWNLDVAGYEDGTIGALWQARADLSSGVATDLRFAYSRFDGTSWTSTYLAQAGPYLYDFEQDYTGGAALDPDHPEVIYISTPIDPRDDSVLAHHEIWQGVTCDGGETFAWTPITVDSDVDNLRPTVPKWDDEHTALVWFRGTYTSAQEYGTEVVALILGPE